jgi:DNA-binding NarL/FixJ family response regulator
MSLVLNTGVYPPLIETRRLILEQAGHTVITAVEDQEIVKACRRYKFDVAVIGQSVPPKVKRHFLNLIRRECTTAKILELISPDIEQALKTADSWLELSSQAPFALANRVNELAKGGNDKAT